MKLWRQTETLIVAAQTRHPEPIWSRQKARLNEKANLECVVNLTKVSVIFWANVVRCNKNDVSIETTGLGRTRIGKSANCADFMLKKNGTNMNQIQLVKKCLSHYVGFWNTNKSCDWSEKSGHDSDRQKNNKCKIIDSAVHSDSRVDTKEIEKIPKYQWVVREHMEITSEICPNHNWSLRDNPTTDKKEIGGHWQRKKVWNCVILYSVKVLRKVLKIGGNLLSATHFKGPFVNWK